MLQERKNIIIGGGRGIIIIFGSKYGTLCFELQYLGHGLQYIGQGYCSQKKFQIDGPFNESCMANEGFSTEPFSVPWESLLSFIFVCKHVHSFTPLLSFLLCKNDSMHSYTVASMSSYVQAIFSACMLTYHAVNDPLVGGASPQDKIPHGKGGGDHKIIATQGLH
jgi:hypothetical protein